MDRPKQLDILLVDDDPADVELTEEALEESKLVVKLHNVGDGIEAMAFLKKEGAYSNAPKPDLILLDLNMPRKDGRQVLAEMKEDPELKAIPVVVLTTSQADEDILRSYNLGANCYVTKPVGLEQFIRVVESIEEFWFTVVKLPTRT